MKASDSILWSQTLLKLKRALPPKAKYEELQEQVRNFHLMLPSRITYCDRWENQILPLIQKMQHKNRIYVNDFDYNYSPDSTTRLHLTDVIMDCFVPREICLQRRKF